ncbi:response regulator [Adhaeribacter swui]|uniref:Response regulator n=1 Tax=Adhaeribacter swui TaxID=2086471 RepID=A0A7G7G4B4_9BACT|nr:response regulator [Adhaeribacter swui]QNF31998.1 response regulator [Adhaeribacter swui]
MGRKTFLVDDDAISALLTKHLLKMHQFTGEIITFHQPEDALNSIIDSITNELPALLLLDLNMPFLSGWQFLDALAPYQQTLITACKIYILTSSLEYADELKSKEYPLVTGFIQKPIRSEDIQNIQNELNKG